MRRSEIKKAEPDLGMLAARLLFVVQSQLHAAHEKTGHADSKPRHGAVLAYLDEEGSRATDIAEASGQHKQVIGTLVDELEELGRVKRVPDPSDRRAKLIVPTANGLAHMRKADEVMAGIDRRLAKELGAKEYAEFKATLRRVAELLLDR